MSKLIYYEYKNQNRNKEHFYDTYVLEPPAPNCTIPAGKSVCLTTGRIASFTPNYVTRLLINNFISTIKPYAFKNSIIQSIEIQDPESGYFRIIGDGAFSDCKDLISVDPLPWNIHHLGEGVFSGCSKLSNIVFNTRWVYTIPKLTFANTILNNFIIPVQVVSIGDSAFYNCKLTTISISDKITSIGSNAFNGCPLNIINMNADTSTLDTISDLAFANTNISTFTIPSTIINIGINPFANCKRLQLSVNSNDNYILDNSILYNNDKTIIIAGSSADLFNVPILNNVINIGDYAFNGCINVTSIILSDNVTNIGLYAFSGCSRLKNITLPNNITILNDYAFSGCSSLTSITIPNSVTSIGLYAFNGCSSLQNINIPTNITIINDNTFNGCISLASITIPNSVISIGNNVFNKCSNLISITIPNNVTRIGTSLFSECSKLANIIMSDNITYINDYTFNSCTALRNINIPTNVTSMGIMPFKNCINLNNIIFNDINNSKLNTISDYAFTEVNISNFIIPPRVINMGFNPFNGKGLAILQNIDVTLNPNFNFDTNNYILYNKNNTSVISYLGYYNKTQIEIKNTVTNINSNVFLNSKLTSINLNNAPINYIGDSVFKNCPLSNFIIPETVTYIGKDAFTLCKFTNITIPDNVIKIDDRAFYYIRLLTSITINKTSKLEYIGGNAFADTQITELFIPRFILSPLALFTYLPTIKTITLDNPISSFSGGYKNSLIVPVPYHIILDENVGTLRNDGANSNIAKLTITKKINTDNAVLPIRSLKEVDIQNSRISSNQFNNCTALTSATLSNNITYIGNNAFSTCYNLKILNIYCTKNNVTLDGNDIFRLVNYIGTINVIDNSWDNYFKELYPNCTINIIVAPILPITQTLPAIPVINQTIIDIINDPKTVIKEVDGYNTYINGNTTVYNLTSNTSEINNIINFYKTRYGDKYNYEFTVINGVTKLLITPMIEKFYEAYEANVAVDVPPSNLLLVEVGTQVNNTSIAQTSVAQTSIAQTSVAQTTMEPTTIAPTTMAPTIAPTTIAPTTIAPTTIAPTTIALPNILNSYINKQVCGENHNIVLMKNGTLYAMGDNTNFQLGSNDITIKFNTINKINNSNWIDVATISNTTFGINDIGEIYYWGNLFHTLPKVAIPTKIFFSNTLKAKKIACGLNHLLVLDTFNNLYGYGNNTKFQIQGDANINSPTPIPDSNFYLVSATKNRYDNIYCNSNYSVIARNNGSSYITGSFANDISIKKQFGNIFIDSKNNLYSISCGPNHYIYTTFTIDSNNNKMVDNKIVVIGSNEFGQIGNNINNLNPKYIYAGNKNTFFVDNNNILYVCGTYNNTNNLTFTEIAKNVTNDINIVSNNNYTIISYNQNIIINTTFNIVSVLQSGFNTINNTINNLPTLSIVVPTSAALTSAAQTSAASTSAAPTSAALTSAALTSAAQTSAASTSAAQTSAAQTSAAQTSAELTSAAENQELESKILNIATDSDTINTYNNNTVYTKDNIVVYNFNDNNMVDKTIDMIKEKYGLDYTYTITYVNNIKTLTIMPIKKFIEHYTETTSANIDNNKLAVVVVNNDKNIIDFLATFYTNKVQITNNSFIIISIIILLITIAAIIKIYVLK